MLWRMPCERFDNNVVPHKIWNVNKKPVLHLYILHSNRFELTARTLAVIMNDAVDHLIGASA